MTKDFSNTCFQKNFLWKKFLICSGGAVLMGIGNGLAICSGLGADPITVFYGGMMHTFGVSAGWASNITALLMIAATFFVIIISLEQALCFLCLSQEHLLIEQ